MYIDVFKFFTYNIIFLAFYIIIYFILINNINVFTKRTNNSLQTFKDFVSCSNDNLEKNNEKLSHLESYVTDLERKIITLKTDIEILKSKKKTI